MNTIKAKYKRWGIWIIDDKLKSLCSIFSDFEQGKEYYLLLDGDTILCSIPVIPQEL